MHRPKGRAATSSCAEVAWRFRSPLRDTQNRRFDPQQGIKKMYSSFGEVICFPMHRPKGRAATSSCAEVVWRFRSPLRDTQNRRFDPQQGIKKMYSSFGAIIRFPKHRPEGTSVDRATRHLEIYSHLARSFVFPVDLDECRIAVLYVLGLIVFFGLFTFFIIYADGYRALVVEPVAGLQCECRISF